MAGKGWKWRKIERLARHGWKWLDMAGNGLEMAGM